MNIESNVENLRHETARPEARERTLQAIRDRGRAKPVARWRWVAVAGACALLSTPLFLSTRGGQSFAAEFQRSIEATREAPIVHERITVVRAGKATLGEGELWTTGNLIARTSNASPAQFEVRMGPKKVFWRYSNYETVQDRHDSGNLVESPIFANRYSLESVLKSTEGPRPERKLLGSKSATWMGKPVRQYTLALNLPGSVHLPKVEEAIFVDPKSSRIVGMETTHNWGKPSPTIFRTIIDYPAAVDASVFEPPARSNLPRFDLDREEELARKRVSQAKAVVVKGESVRLLDVTQSIGGTLAVVWEGQPMGADAEHLIRLNGAPLKTFGYKLRFERPYRMLNWLARRGVLKTVDVEIPVHRGRTFVGYARFKQVPVRQTASSFSITSAYR